MIRLTTMDEFTQSILNSYYNGTLILEKHDPNKVLKPLGSFRTVVSQYISASVERLIKEMNSNKSIPVFPPSFFSFD